MSPIRTTTGILWTLALGAVALYVFFLALDAIRPSDATWLAIAMGVVALACLIHFIRVRRALGDGRHEELARSVHAMREKRGF
jgi:hypothetical protein